MRARAYCAHPSIRDNWALRCMSRCPDQVVSLKRDPQFSSPQASLVLICRNIERDRITGLQEGGFFYRTIGARVQRNSSTVMRIY
ncbi:hypothetical protein TNCV_4531141 [Trichonephila clavipes]|nr:hypothetical protein TNCV_4531141 [Trichonephila clavipes]